VRSGHIIDWSGVSTGWAASYGREKVEQLRICFGLWVFTAVRRLKPYPEGWLASIPALSQLPHYPMVLHRGGFPDGS
jgi:hypothetical protein